MCALSFLLEKGAFCGFYEGCREAEESLNSLFETNVFLKISFIMQRININKQKRGVRV